jgi:thioredoxin 1
MGQKTFQVTSENFQDEVVKSALPVLLDFTAEWCPPCKMLEPIVDEIAKKYAAFMRVGKLDIDANPDLPEMFDVWGFPTLILFKEGQPVERIVGFKRRDQIEAALARHLQLEQVR